jgi:hypothetical protein
MSRARIVSGSLALLSSLGCGAGCADPAGPVEGPVCGPADIDGLRVSATDPLGGTPYALGYPPHAIDGCQLAYLAEPAQGESAALVLRDLTTGDETVVAPAAERPRRPSLAGDVLAWEADAGGVAVIRVRTGGATVTLEGPFHHAGEPRAAADGVVFTAFLDGSGAGDTDIYMAAPGESAATSVFVGAGQQRFADISASHIAFSDFSEDPDGQLDENATDLADIVIVERATGTARTRSRAGKQAFPLLGAGDKVVYLEWGPDHPEPKFSAYDLLIGNVGGNGQDDALAAQIRTSLPYIRPTARGERVSWIGWPEGGGPALWTRPADLSAPAETVAGIEGPELFGPAASADLTVVVVAEGGVATLQAVEH